MAAYTAAALTVVAAGTAIYGQYKANKAQAKAERANAAFYEEQAKFAQDSLERELAIYDEEVEQFRGTQVSGYARGGVDLSGSPLLVLAQTTARAEAEKNAMVKNSSAQQREALLKAGASMEQADRLTSWQNQVLPAIGVGAGAAAQSASLIRSKK